MEPIVLTEDEEQVVAMVATGWDNQTIAYNLCIEVQSMANLLHKIYKKLGLCGRKGDKRVMLTNWYEHYQGN